MDNLQKPKRKLRDQSAQRSQRKRTDSQNGPLEVQVNGTVTQRAASPRRKGKKKKKNLKREGSSGQLSDASFQNQISVRQRQNMEKNMVTSVQQDSFPVSRLSTAKPKQPMFQSLEKTEALIHQQTDLESSNLTSVKVKKCNIKPNTAQKQSQFNKDLNQDQQYDDIDSIHSITPRSFSEDERVMEPNNDKPNTTNMSVDINVQLSTNLMVTQNQFNNIFHQQGHNNIKLRQNHSNSNNQLKESNNQIQNNNTEKPDPGENSSNQASDKRKQAHWDKLKAFKEAKQRETLPKVEEEPPKTIEKPKINLLADMLGKSQNKNKSPEYDECCQTHAKHLDKPISPTKFNLPGKLETLNSSVTPGDLPTPTKKTEGKQDLGTFGGNNALMKAFAAKFKQTNFFSTLQESSPLKRQNSKNYDKNAKNKKLAGLSQYTKERKRKFFLEKKDISGSKMGKSTTGNDSMTSSALGQSQSQYANSKAKNVDQDLRSVFIDNYGVSMDIPAYYLHDSKFVPHYRGYVVTTGYHIIPKKQMYQENVQTTYIDQRVQMQAFNEIFSNTGDSLILNLMKVNGRTGLEKIKEIVIRNSKSSIIQFSRSGKFFGLFINENKNFEVYDATDIDRCFKDIDQGKPVLKTEVQENDGTFQATSLIFDKSDKYVLLASKEQILIYSLQPETIGQMVKNYTIDQEKYSEIHDIILDSGLDRQAYLDKFQTGHRLNESMEQMMQNILNLDYCCSIACKHIGITGVHIFDINNEKDIRSISYEKKQGELFVKISDDLFTCVLSTGYEHYLLKGMGQQNLPNIKDKVLRNVISKDDQFYLVTSKDYDRDIDILHTEDENFNASIKRMLEPGLLDVKDSYVVCHSVDSKDGNMVILSKAGENLYIDTISLELGYKDDPDAAVVDTCVDNNYFAYGFNWPYFSFATKENFVFIYNAFNSNFIQRYELPSNVQRINKTFLTDTHDFYTLCETKDDHMEVYTIDLDCDDPYINGPILRYGFDTVHNKLVNDFHVRGSSRKEKINLNRQLIIFVLHENELWGWNSKELKMISDKASNMYYLSDDQMFYMDTNDIHVGGKHVEHSEVMMIECLFGSYKITSVYEEREKKAEILNFGVDNQRRRLIILSGVKNTKDKRDKFVAIFDIDTEQILVRIKIQSREIIGRMKSNLYNFTDGHIYYNNKVIKVRYDLLQTFKGGEILEHQLFDHYQDVIKLKSSHDTIQSGMPLQTCLYNRLAYIINNVKRLEPKRLLILPYLHERRIYLNRRHTANQFYTIQRSDGLNYILCMCFNDNKMYVYTETGILCERIKYNDITEKCGRPECISESGKYYLFHKSNVSTILNIVESSVYGMKIVYSIDLKEKVQKYISNLVMQQLKKKLQSDMAKKKIDLPKKKYRESDDPDDEEGIGIEPFQNSKLIQEFWQFYLNSLNDIKKVHLSFNINDVGDLQVRIKPSKSFVLWKMAKKKSGFKNPLADDDDMDGLKEQESLLNCSFFYYFANTEGANKENGEYLYFDSQYDNMKEIKGASMNENSMFFWSLGNVWSFCLRKKRLLKLALYISEKEEQTYVKRVRCGSDKNVVGIRVAQSPVKDCVIYWNLQENLEINSFDIDADAMTFQDGNGHPYIIDRNYVINGYQGCKLMCYNVASKDLQDYQQRFGFQYGHRVETLTHNWMIFRNFINMSFSYMTFVIKENFDKNSFSMTDYLFDLEGYDYILNRNSVFTEGNLVKQEYEKLLFIMKNYQLNNQILLEILQYSNDQQKLPLHLALEANNNRMVNLILINMSKIDYVAVHSIKDIFKDLINYKNFEQYLEECPFQTKQMQNKQTIRIMKQRNDDNDERILICSHSKCSYVDDEYFKDEMGEVMDKPECLTYAVKIQCIRVDWIINETFGLKFLKELLKQQNKDIFLTPYILIVIEFLYIQYSNKIKSMLMPPFILHIISVILAVISAELYRSQIMYNNVGQTFDMTYDLKNLVDVGDEDVVWLNKKLFILQFLARLFCAILNIINFFTFFQQSYHMRQAQFYRGWAYLDLIILGSNLVVTFSLFGNVKLVPLRVFESILIVAIFFKSLYFLRLIGEIAPLIDIIFTILSDIKYFMAIYLISQLAFVFAFYSIGKNQEQLAGGDEDLIPPYASMLGAMTHVYLASLGEFDVDFYFGHQMTVICMIIFLALSFFMCIHMLNMLIAIMGEIFSNNNENKESKKKMSQLAFVVENWWIDPILDKKQIVYLLAAFKIDDQDENDEERFEKLNEKNEKLQNMMTQLMTEIKTLQYQVGQVQAQNEQAQQHC